MIVRKLLKQKLKPECVDEYIKAHDEIWQDLIDEYKAGGMKNISCFLDGLDLYVFLEYDDNGKPPVEYEKSVDKRWQEYMNTLKDMTAGNVDIKEVYRMK